MLRELTYVSVNLQILQRELTYVSWYVKKNQIYLNSNINNYLNGNTNNINNINANNINGNINSQQLHNKTSFY